jgi:hypothetical protein
MQQRRVKEVVQAGTSKDRNHGRLPEPAEHRHRNDDNKKEETDRSRSEMQHKTGECQQRDYPATGQAFADEPKIRTVAPVSNVHRAQHFLCIERIRFSVTRAALVKHKQWIKESKVIRRG